MPEIELCVIMNAIDYVGIAKRKRSLNRRDRPERGIMNAVDYVGIAKRKRSLNRSPGLTVLQPTRSSRAEFYKTEISENI